MADPTAPIEQVGAPAHVVAHSLGTQVAQHLAANRPDLVDALIPLGPIRELPHADKTATLARAATVREQGMQSVADTVAVAGTAATSRGQNPLVAPFVRELLLPGGDYGFAWTPHGRYARDLEHFVTLLGFTPMEAILSATALGGEIMLKPEDPGKVTPGYKSGRRNPGLDPVRRCGQ